MNIIGSLIWVLAAWKWGDWRNWQKYYPTMLFVVVVSLTHDFVTYKQGLWTFKDYWLPTHTLNSLVITLIAMPASILIYLPHFPEESWLKKARYIALWVGLYMAIETFFYMLDLIHYDNNWSYWWSVAFNCAMFPILRLHHTRPILAYVVLLPLAFVYLKFFGVSVGNMK